MAASLVRGASPFGTRPMMFAMVPIRFQAPVQTFGQHVMGEATKPAAVEREIKQTVQIPEILRQSIFDLTMFGEANEYVIGESTENVIVGDAMEESEILFIKRTWQPSVIRRKRKHGFLKKLSSADGRNVLQRRRAVGRHRLVPL